MFYSEWVGLVHLFGVWRMRRPSGGFSACGPERSLGLDWAVGGHGGKPLGTFFPFLVVVVLWAKFLRGVSFHYLGSL